MPRANSGASAPDRKKAGTFKQANPSAPPCFAHQIVSILKRRASPIVFDTSDPGTGKTRVEIEFVALDTMKDGATLVVAPKSLLRSAWEADFKKFAPNVRVSVATAEHRAEAFAVEADVYVTNTDAVVWLAKQPAKFFKRFRLLVVDEMSLFKHHTSARSKALNKIKKYFAFRHALTGTPNSNAITDLWNQVFVLDDGKRLGKSFFQFRNSTQNPKQVGPSAQMVKWEDKPGAEMAVTDLLKDIVIRNKLEDCIDLPANHEYSVPFTMSAKHKKVYEVFERDALAMVAGNKIISAVNAAGVMTKLLQIASGATYTGAEEGEWVDLAQERYELIADLVAQRQHSVVFFNWAHQKANLIAEFKKQGIPFAVIDGTVSERTRAEIVKDYQAGAYQVVLAHPQAAGHGLTLTRGTATIWASPTFNLEHWLQGNHRIYRAGQQQKTETIVVVALGTAEEHVLERLTAKNTKQLAVLDLLQSLAKGN